MRLCAHARPSASDSLDTDTCEGPEPELVFCERERTPCPRSLSLAVPKARFLTGTSPPQLQAHLLLLRLPPQPLLLYWHHTLHPQARLPPSNSPRTRLICLGPDIPSLLGPGISSSLPQTITRPTSRCASVPAMLVPSLHPAVPSQPPRVPTVTLVLRL